MTGLLILGLNAGLAAMPPLPVPPAPMSPPMATVDVGGATVVFPHGAHKLQRPPGAEAEVASRMRARAPKGLDPKIVEKAIARGAQSEAWNGVSGGEGFMVIVGPAPGDVVAICRAETVPGRSCRTAHAGAAQGELLRRERPDGTVSETLILSTATRRYTVSYNQFRPAARRDETDGLRFIRSFRFGGQPVVFGPPAR